jgi:acetyl esterase/lipase
VIQDIPYLGTNSDETMDLYFPTHASGRDRPALLVIHGGGFCGADKADAREQSICADLTEAGYVCASINYALGTRENRWLTYPQNLRDAKSAVAFLRQRADEYGLDPERIGTIGGSAGGTLSLWLALTADNGELRPPGIDTNTSVAVQVAVNLYGPTDFSQPLPFTTPAELILAASPIHQVTPEAPPILTVQGLADELVAPLHAELLQQVLNKAGVPNEVKFVEGGTHGMDLQPEQEDLRPVVLPFINRALG